MTRLTNPTYLNQRKELAQEWRREGGGALIMLSRTEQWALHDFYALTDKLNDEQAMAHRKAATQASPSLPQRAGKASAHLAFFTPRLQAYVVARVQAPIRKKGAATQIHILSQVNPYLDPERIAQILFDAAMEQRDRDREDKNKAA
jgi:hypothetical protein